MSASTKLVVVLFGVTVLLLALALFSARKPNSQFMTVSGAAAAIRRDLPQGTPRKDVEHWLDSRRISRSSDGTVRQEIALLHDVRKDAVSRSDLRIIFTFDDRDRLLAFVVEELTAASHGEERQERMRD